MTLLARLIIFNTCAIAFVVWAWLLGYVQAALVADTSGISYAILALFGLGIAASFWRAVKISAMPAMPLNMRRRHAAKAPAQNNHLSEIAKWLAMLGMFGTVVGLIQMAFSLKGSLGGADNLAAAIALAFDGYGVALVTTAVGIVTGAWIEVNALLIGTATDGLVKDTGGE